MLDGAMGTMIQHLHLKENDYRGDLFKSHGTRLFGCNDLLCLTQGDKIYSIHKAYIDAGADIITTNSFNSNSISMSDYGLTSYPGLIYKLNHKAAAIAKSAADSCEREILVAGSIGPTNRAASISPDIENPAFRNVTYDALFNAYSEQVEGLIDGGVDILLFETVFDTLNLKAGLEAANGVMEKKGIKIPIMVSATLSDKAGRTLSGQTLRAFITSIGDYDNVVTIGLNCGFGGKDMLPHILELGKITKHYVSAHPNAGLPNVLGEYEETPEIFAQLLATAVESGLLNIVGGCCGTTPDHIAALSSKIKNAKPHKPAVIADELRVSGLEVVEVIPENNFINVGERCNVAGSRKFLRLIKEQKYDEALQIARKQVEDGAMLIDINMDDPLVDAEKEMVTFLRLIASEPDVAKAPIMIDSSNWNVIEASLKNIQGKSIVNSISLKEGEEEFIRRGKRIRQLGAAVIVMAFDEEGQADTYERKIAICRRAYDLLTEKCGLKPEDIIFDVNIMAVATGIEAHDRYGIDYIRAVEWVKKNLPGTHTSGGVSNLSFAFRGKNYLRECMHAVFLYHAIAAGLDMGIVNPAANIVYDDIENDLRTVIEDVILFRRSEAGEELSAYAMSDQAVTASQDKSKERDLSVSVNTRLKEAIIKGKADFLYEDLDEAAATYKSAVKIIDGPLMEGMNRVGELFAAGKMFLPQVVKTARTMKMAVDHLKPLMEADSTARADKKAGKIVFATVKGDVHDIGKNIVSIVLACNNYEVIDLGVMVPVETIIETTIREKPDLICLSGLITPSLAEMVNVARAMEEQGLNIPLLVGGATTSKIHTALKISPVYHGPVVHVTDAAQNPIVASKLLNPISRIEFLNELEDDYQRIRDNYNARSSDTISLAEARSRCEKIDWRSYEPPYPALSLGEAIVIDLKLTELVRFINWKMFFHAWRIPGNMVKKFPYDGCVACVNKWKNGLPPGFINRSEEVLQLYKDAQNLLSELLSENHFDGKGAIAFYKANASGDNVRLGNVTIPLLRQQTIDSKFLSLADFIAPEGVNEDIAGVFIVTAGKYLAEMAQKFKQDGDSYRSLLYQSLSDRIAEAGSEWLHLNVRRKYWGYAPDENIGAESILRGEYQGIRPALGYPMLPDQLLNHLMGDLLPLKEIGVSLTENGAMSPSSTVSGLYISHPASHYFMIGAIGDDQVEDYALRRGESKEKVKNILRM